MENRDWHTADLLQQIDSLPVLVVGDLILDHYIWGDAFRISPEAPVPVVAVEKDSYTAGGAANVALNLRKLRAGASVAGVLGDDEAGRKLVSLLEQEGVDALSGLCQRVVATIVKTRVVVRQQQMCRLDREQSPRVYRLDSSAAFAALNPVLDRVKAVIISDYAKGVVTETLVQHLIKEGQRRGLLVALDPKPTRPMVFSGIGLMTPNRKESHELAEIPHDPHSPFPAEQICQQIWEKYRPAHLVITLGSEGMLLCQNGEVVGVMPTYAREVFDVSGAGDTVIAALTAALAGGASLEAAAHLANTAAGVVVGKLGTATADREEILSYEAHIAG